MNQFTLLNDDHKSRLQPLNIRHTFSGIYTLINFPIIEYSKLCCIVVALPRLMGCDSPDHSTSQNDFSFSFPLIISILVKIRGIRK